MSVSTIPVLDLAGFRADEDGPAGEAFVTALRTAFHETGLAYVTGHGIDPGLGRRVHAVARAFFALPEADRMAIQNIHSPQFRGYTPVGQELTNGERDLRDQVDVGRDEPAPTLGPDDPPYLRLRGPNLWPAALPEFREVVTAWDDALEGVGQTLSRAIGRALGQAPDAFADILSPPEIRTKIIHYPAPSEEFPTDQGVGSHRDGGFLTFVHQDAIGGLEAQLDGTWIDVPPVDGALVVNIGEMLQLISAGYFTATVHRVVSPPPGSDRVSIAFFFNPRYDTVARAVDLPADLAAQVARGGRSDGGDPILSVFGEHTLRVRLRAHPDVAARHHADLLTPAAGDGS